MGARCRNCGRPGADIHTLLCDGCLVSLPPYFRKQAERMAISAALLRQALMNGEQMALRWTEQQYRDFLQKTQEPPKKESRKSGPPKPPKTNPNTLRFELPLTPTRNALDRMHYRAKRRLMQKLGDAFREQLPPASGIPFRAATVEIVRYSSKELDPDAMIGFTKPILDAMQVPRGKLHPYGAYIIENDNSECVKLTARWEKCSPKRGMVLVLVTPI